MISLVYIATYVFQLQDSSARELCWTSPNTITLWENMNRHIAFNQNQNPDVIILWQPHIARLITRYCWNSQINFLWFHIDKAGTTSDMGWKSWPAFQSANHKPDKFCFPCTINYFGFVSQKALSESWTESNKHALLIRSWKSRCIYKKLSE